MYRFKPSANFLFMCYEPIQNPACSKLATGLKPALSVLKLIDWFLDCLSGFKLSRTMHALVALQRLTIAFSIFSQNVG